MNLDPKDKQWELLQAWKMIRYHVYHPLEVFPQAAMDTLNAHFGTGHTSSKPNSPAPEPPEEHQRP